jgi:uncharacterized protein (DUF1501 family)
MLSRRNFVKVGGVMTMAGAMAPNFIAHSLSANATTDSLASAALSPASLSNNQRALVVVQLTGGNDGLNTVIPYSDDTYHQVRPTIGYSADQVLKLDDQLGLNPAMQAFKDFYDAGQLAIIRGAGYPNPNYSHFRSMEIWQSGYPDQVVNSGWIGRYLDSLISADGSNAHDIGRLGMSVGQAGQGGGAPLSMWTSKTVVLSYNGSQSFRFIDNAANNDRDAQLAAAKKIYNVATGNNVADYIRNAALDALSASDQLEKIASSYKTDVTYPNTPFALRLKNIAQVLTSDFGARIFYVPTDGSFDTHFNENQQGAGQVGYHAKLLGTLADGLSAFYKDLASKNLSDSVMTMTFSEFGRRVGENGSHGTDHGSAEPMFVLGGNNAVKGGMYGTQPSLTDLDNGNLKVQVDFRSVYSTVLKNWLGTNPNPVVGGDFPLLDFVNSKVS